MPGPRARGRASARIPAGSCRRYPCRAPASPNRADPRIGGVLMPWSEAGIMRFLDEEAGVPAQDIRTQQGLDGIEDSRMPDHVVDPGEQHVAAMAHLALDRASAFGLIVLELAAKIGHFARAQRADREVVAPPPITGNFTPAHHLANRFPPPPHLF